MFLSLTQPFLWVIPPFIVLFLRFGRLIIPVSLIVVMVLLLPRVIMIINVLVTVTRRRVSRGGRVLKFHGIRRLTFRAMTPWRRGRLNPGCGSPFSSLRRTTPFFIRSVRRRHTILTVLFIRSCGGLTRNRWVIFMAGKLPRLARVMPLFGSTVLKERLVNRLLPSFRGVKVVKLPSIGNGSWAHIGRVKVGLTQIAVRVFTF